MRDVLLLRVDMFCKDICEAISQWETNVAADRTVQERLSALLKIHELASYGVPGVGYVAPPSR
jgi:hypothetical protein